MWLENRFTAEGRIMHDRVDSGKSETRWDVRIAFAVSLRSLRLRLVGKADVEVTRFINENFNATIEDYRVSPAICIRKNKALRDSSRPPCGGVD